MFDIGRSHVENIIISMRYRFPSSDACCYSVSHPHDNTWYMLQKTPTHEANISSHQLNCFFGLGCLGVSEADPTLDKA